MKREISKSQLRFLRKELSHFEKEEILNEKQIKAILSSYTVKNHDSFIYILLTIGAGLVGIGILSFIAGNWELLPNYAKMILLFLGLTVFYFTGWSLEETYPKTAKSMYYIGLAIYGAGIFQIGQIFHLSPDTYFPFLIWTVGAVPLAVYLKDIWIGMFSITLMGMFVYYGSGAVWKDYYFYLGLVSAILFLMYWANERIFQQSKRIFLWNNILFIYTGYSLLVYLDVNTLWIAIIYWLIGVSFVLIEGLPYPKVFKWLGTVLHGISGILLTYPLMWNLFGDTNEEMYSILFAILYTGINLYFIQKGSLTSVIMVCALILRYYIDLSFDFLPKSVFFIIGGIILITFGFWFERRRRRVKNAKKSQNS